jgi:hypothetical protein
MDCSEVCNGSPKEKKLHVICLLQTMIDKKRTMFYSAASDLFRC